MSSFSIVNKAEGGWAEYAAELNALSVLPNVTLGVAVPDEPHPGPRAKGVHTYLDIAIINELGDPGRDIPARPIFGPALDKNEQVYVARIQAALRRALKKSGTKQQLISDLHAIAGQMVEDVHSEIDNYSHQVPLADATVERKGHDQPWVESDKLAGVIDAVTEVRASYTPAGFRDNKGRFTKVG